jgi:hypothetical protein
MPRPRTYPTTEAQLRHKALTRTARSHAKHEIATGKGEVACTCKKCRQSDYRRVEIECSGCGETKPRHTARFCRQCYYVLREKQGVDNL